MEEYNTIEKVKELFNNAGCVGNENCYFVAYKDFQKSSGMVNGMEYPYHALLINQTENGLGIFYLNPEKFSFKVDFAKLKVSTDTYNFIKNEDIKSIEIKNWAIFNSKTKRITIKLNNKKIYRLYANINEKLIPYQTENLTKFIEKNSK